MVKRGRRYNSKRYSNKNKTRPNTNRRPKRRERRKISFFGKINRFAKRHPITIGVLLIIVSIVLFRLSFVNDVLSNPEFSVWVWIISLGLFIAGIAVLFGWWRNHISMLTTKHDVNWRNR